MKNQMINAIESGKIINPQSNVPKFIDMVSALAFLTGVQVTNKTSYANEIIDLIGVNDHIIFILVDGLGMNLVNKLNQKSFLRTHLSKEMLAIFPSTTACALTTLATGNLPNIHAIPGWWTYLKEPNLAITTLPFIERFSGTHLSNSNISPDILWHCEPLMRNMKRETFAVSSEHIWDSEFSRYSRGYSSGIGYSSIANSIDIVAKQVQEATTPTYTYVYFHEVDEMCHLKGVESDESLKIVHKFNSELERLASLVNGKARIVISADHGQIDISKEKRYAIFDGDPILNLLHTPPTGDSRVQIFHVIENKKEEFEEMFNSRYGNSISLLSIEDVETLKLLGPQSMNDLSRQRFGDYISIAIDHVTLSYYPDGESPEDDSIGNHSGLSSEEMKIPLIII